jgi:hypothetical protein
MVWAPDSPDLWASVLGLTIFASADHASELVVFDGILPSCQSPRTSSPTAARHGEGIAEVKELLVSRATSTGCSATK